MAYWQYEIYRTQENNFDTAVKELILKTRLDGRETLRILFFGRANDNTEYALCRDRITALCRESFGLLMPAVGFIAQTPLHSSLAAEVTFAPRGKEMTIVRHQDYIVVNDREIISAAVTCPAMLDTDTAHQSKAALDRVGEILHAEGFSATDIVRQWNYMQHITRFTPQGQNYQLFNDARSRFYDASSWGNGYPAATGIGTQAGGIIVVFNAEKGLEVNVPLDNPLQVAAHAYSQQVLIDKPENKCKTTPKFERARYTEADGQNTIYISGTAAIRGEGSCTDGITAQTAMTMDNIEKLTDCDNLSRYGLSVVGHITYSLLRIYIKREEDAAAATAWIAEHYPSAKTIFLLADICREELLIEVEGIAEYQNR